MKKFLTLASVVVLTGAGTVSVGVGQGVAQGAEPAAGLPAASVTATKKAEAPAVHTYTPPAPAWRPCTTAALKEAKAECGFVTVPLDYDDPDGTTIEIAVSRIAAKKPARYRGPILVNPGGPGGSGLGLSQLGSQVPHNAGDGYDWIGFDPRGVGASRPRLTCRGDYFGYNRPDYRVRTAAQLRLWLNRAKSYADACLNSPGAALLPYVKTTDNVEDMESIRKALRADRISYYGFSYGTYLGQVYATRYPKRVARMVLDSSVDPRDVWYRANLNQDVAFDENFGSFLAWIARYDSVYRLGKDADAIEKRYYVTRDALAKRPAAGGKVGPDEFTDAFIRAGYNVAAWPDSAEALARALRKKDFSGVLAASTSQNPQGPGSDNSFAMYNATQCTDVRWPTSWAVWQRDNDRVARRSPFLTWSNAWYNASCLFWRATPAAQAPRVDGRQAPPTLLLAETKDAATPWPGSVQVRRLFPKSVLVEGVGGTTHASSLSGVPCVDDTVAAFLKAGILPTRTPGEGHSDKRCRPLAPPVPTAEPKKRVA